MNLRNLPNSITILRIVLVMPIVVLLLMHAYRAAFYVFLVASISDGIDGFLARYFKWISRFGSIADPLADKLLMLGCFATLAWLGCIPLWVWILVFVRDLVISFGALYYQHRIKDLVFQPSWISKVNTVAQLLLIGLLLLDLAIQPVATIWTMTVMWVMVVTTSISLINYLWVWGWRAWFKLNRCAL